VYSKLKKDSTDQSRTSLPPLIASGIWFRNILQSVVYPLLYGLFIRLLGFAALQFVVCRRLYSYNTRSILNARRLLHYKMRSSLNNWNELHWTITLGICRHWIHFMLPGPVLVDISWRHGLVFLLQFLMLMNLSGTLSKVLSTLHSNLACLSDQVTRRQLILTLATLFPALCLWGFIH
jgi:hypothetical protein